MTQNHGSLKKYELIYYYELSNVLKGTHEIGLINSFSSFSDHRILLESYFLNMYQGTVGLTRRAYSNLIYSAQVTRVSFFSTTVTCNDACNPMC